MNTFKLIPLVLAAAVAFPISALEHGKTGNTSVAVQETQKAETTEAEVRKIDKDAKKIILKHGEIKNLDMGAMTMVFQVNDPAMLDKVKAGDKVRFTADRIKGAIVVMSIEKIAP